MPELGSADTFGFPFDRRAVAVLGERLLGSRQCRDRCVGEVVAYLRGRRPDVEPPDAGRGRPGTVAVAVDRLPGFGIQHSASDACLRGEAFPGVLLVRVGIVGDNPLDPPAGQQPPVDARRPGVQNALALGTDRRLDPVGGRPERRVAKGGEPDDEGHRPRRQ